MQLLRKDISNQDKDLAVSYLRRETHYLQEVLANIEQTHKTDVIYICESLKILETKFKALRKFLGDWV